MHVDLGYINKPSTPCYVTAVLYQDIHDPEYQLLVVAIAGMAPWAIDRARQQKMSGHRKMTRIASDAFATYNPATQKIVSRNPQIDEAVKMIVIKQLAKA